MEIKLDTIIRYKVTTLWDVKQLPKDERDDLMWQFKEDYE